ncbi:MAG: GDSL-type esterase/lipase family protein [Desulfobacterales bacterium]|nr:GDSL-type esterase/lipase family protein [Desulfobacterales bacterium]
MDTSLDLLFIGDSLIEFCNWQDRFPEHQVTNLGRAGETVEGLLTRLESVCRRHGQADRIVLMTGTNNIGMEDYGFPVNYEKILGRLHEQYPRAALIVTSLLPLRLPWIGDSAVPRLNRELEKLCTNLNATFHDLYHRFTANRPTADDRCFASYYLEDDVHLSERGYAVWAQSLAPLLISAGAAGRNRTRKSPNK